MATNESRLRVTELDFDNIKDNLKFFLKGQDKFKDYDFEGSGMNILLDTLAYNTHYMPSMQTWLQMKCSWTVLVYVQVQCHTQKH